MPSVEENIERWDRHDWSRRGEEWGEANEAWRTEAWPWVKDFPWGGTTLEIGPGFGRFTQFLVPRSARLILVDASSVCIEGCRERFRDEANIEYQWNDGYTLVGDPDSVDVVFSHSSLVHAEADVLEAYISQLATMLAPTGRAFLHHSAGVVGRPVWFAESVSGDVVAAMCAAHGLRVLDQHLSAHGSAALTGCSTTFERET